jgi:hypothetical protein
VKPKLVAYFEFLEWTDTNHVRHIKLVGLRTDKTSTAGRSRISVLSVLKTGNPERSVRMKMSAPKGNFRVFGEDHFEQPETQELFCGDFATLAMAKEYCERKLQEMTSFVVYNDKGSVVADYPPPRS